MCYLLCITYNKKKVGYLLIITINCNEISKLLIKNVILYIDNGFKMDYY